MFYSKKLKNFKKLKHCFFSKKNGFSKGIYSGLNCGRGSKDNKKNVRKNLELVAKKMKVEKNKLILMHQTHSNRVKIINEKNYKKKINADAMVTKMKSTALGVVTADCVPIILYDTKNEVIGCIHAGWKGAFSGIIKNTISKIKKINSNNNIYASVGPCIGKKSYEVDLVFFKKFVKKSHKIKSIFLVKIATKKFFDLRKFVTDKLLDCKVKIDQVNHDTYTEKSNFYSFRRSCKLHEKDYGRCISVVSMI